uniref:Larval shell matrix protein 2 n=1 Tax=Pinctada fucata TaxID=50426 RepID=A0A3G2LJ52_PINFU|nr:larval shell matrix protein 2 [Pinctada fucata]
MSRSENKLSKIFICLNICYGFISAQANLNAGLLQRGLGSHIGLIDQESLLDIDPIWSDLDGPIHPSLLRGAGGLAGGLGLAGLPAGLGPQISSRTSRNHITNDRGLSSSGIGSSNSFSQGLLGQSSNSGLSSSNSRIQSTFSQGGQEPRISLSRSDLRNLLSEQNGTRGQGSRSASLTRNLSRRRSTSQSSSGRQNNSRLRSLLSRG